MFAADILKQLTIDAGISFVKLASYKRARSSCSLITAIGLDEPLLNKDIIIIDDILDTGNTLYRFIHHDILPRHPGSVKTLVLLHKPAAMKYNIPADYKGFDIENKFVIGYGLDYNGKGRRFPNLY